MGAHGVAPTWLAQSGHPQGGAQVVLKTVGAHKVVPSWFVFRFFGPWPHLESRLNGYIFSWGTYTSINRLAATWVVPRWISRLGATWVVPILHFRLVSV